MCDFTIIVPVYNEEDNLIRVEKELLAYINMAIKKTAILFVNDGSIDNSLTMIKSICSKNEAFGYISFKTNKGLSAAITPAAPKLLFLNKKRIILSLSYKRRTPPRTGLRCCNSFVHLWQASFLLGS